MLTEELDEGIESLLSTDYTEFNVYVMETENVSKNECLKIYRMTEEEYNIAYNIIRKNKLKRLMGINI